MGLFSTAMLAGCLGALRWLLWGTAALLIALAAPAVAQSSADQPAAPAPLVCESPTGARQHCPADTSGGIVLPGSAKEKPNQVEVVAVGEGKALDSGKVRPMALKVGDKVVFGQYAGSNTIDVDGEELIIMGESEIFAVVE